jgi:hypothetical protein
MNGMGLFITNAKIAFWSVRELQFPMRSENYGRFSPFDMSFLDLNLLKTWTVTIEIWPIEKGYIGSEEVKRN